MEIQDTTSDMESDVQRERTSELESDIQRECTSDMESDVQRERTSDMESDVQRERTSDMESDVQRERTSELESDIKPEFSCEDAAVPLSKGERKNQFIQCGKYIIRLLIERNQRKDIEVTLVVDEGEMNEIYAQLEDGHIPLSVLGKHNAGKSTLINAMIGDRILPTKMLNETAVRVYIRHTSQCHHGPCLTPEGQCERCPCLLPYDLSLAESNRDDLSAQAIGYSFRTHATDTLAKISSGAGKIFRKLKEVNATVRDTKDMKEFGHQLVIANLPALDNVPPSLNVMLVDAPGLADGEKSITQTALESARISAAYIYVLHYQNLDDANDIDALAMLHKKDPDLFTSGRLLIVVSHFDHYYTVEEDGEVVDKDTARDIIRERIKESFDAEITEDRIVFVSGHWADCARYFSKLEANVQRKLSLKVELSRDRFGFEPLDSTAATLLKASGIETLERRIKMLLPSCFKHWIRSTKFALVGYLNDACAALDKAIQIEMTKGDMLKRKYEMSLMWKERIDIHHREMNSTMVGEDAKLYKDLQVDYDSDVKEIIVTATEFVTGEYDRFFERCTDKASSRQGYALGSFKQDIEQFLKRLLPVVQDMFDGARMESINRTLNKAYLVLGDNNGKLTVAAQTFCDQGQAPNPTTETDDMKLEDVLKDQPIQLMKLRQRIKISEFEPRGLLEKIVRFFRKGWRSLVRVVHQRILPQEGSGGYEGPESEGEQVLVFSEVTDPPSGEKATTSETQTTNGTTSGGDEKAERKKVDGKPQTTNTRPKLSTKQVMEGIGTWKEDLLNEISRYSQDVKFAIIKYFYEMYVNRGIQLLSGHEHLFNDRIKYQMLKMAATKKNFELHHSHARLLYDWRSDFEKQREKVIQEAEALCIEVSSLE